MLRFLRVIAVAIPVLAIASGGALYLFGRFVDRSLGAPSAALDPAAGPPTAIDRSIVPQTEARPGQTGLVLLRENLDAFAFRLHAAREAGRSIDAMYYIWQNDETGRLLALELLRAAERGVRVRVLLDDINARGKDRGIYAIDRHPNVEVRMFNPSRNREGAFGRAAELLLRAFSLNRRMHNKAWIADGRAAIVGGRNIGDEYFDAAEETNFRDMDLLLLGPAVAETSRIFDQFWNSRMVLPISALHHGDGPELAAIRASLEETAGKAASSPYLARVAESPNLRRMLDGTDPLIWTSQVRVVSDPPEKAAGGEVSYRVLDSLTPLLDSARSEALLISPYFVPGEWGSAKFTDLVDANTRVAVLTNSLAATDVGMVHAGYSRYRRQLLRAGVELHELMPTQHHALSSLGTSNASLHTKAFLIDGERGFIGSFNLDPRSAELNTEMGVLFVNAALGGKVRDEFVRETQPGMSFRVFLDAGKLRWEDGRSTPPRIWKTEPESSLLRRAGVRILSWLPIESQL